MVNYARAYTIYAYVRSVIFDRIRIIIYVASHTSESQCRKCCIMVHAQVIKTNSECCSKTGLIPRQGCGNVLGHTLQLQFASQRGVGA